MREAKVLEFIKQLQGNIRVKEYVLKFMRLSRYAHTTVVDPRERMSKFILGVSNIVVKELLTFVLINDMGISSKWCMLNKSKRRNFRKILRSQ